MVRISILPREEKFFDLFELAVQSATSAAQKLKELVDKWEHAEAVVAEITEIEHQGDTVTHQIYAQLHRTFVTPFDREDISHLAGAIDDITDFIQAAADAMLVYKIERPGKNACELAEIIVSATREVETAVKKLKNRNELKNMLASCVEVNRLENMADRVYRTALGELFDGKTDLVDVIKWREIYEHMESATDRCEDVADVLEGVALKQA
jgi:predicted phosphate transport protein (TIGR00153 family)